VIPDPGSAPDGDGPLAGPPTDGRSGGLPIAHWNGGADRGRVGDDHGGATPGDGDMPSDGQPGPEGPPAFYFDFRDPESYLAAERVLRTLPVATPWVPVDAARLPGPHAWEGFRCAADEQAARERVARRAAERGLQPVVWPAEVPFDSTRALRAAWYAKELGRVVSFSLPAFRQAYAGGHDLGSETFVLIAASAAEMHPRAISQALTREPVAAALAVATERAIARGVRTTPAIWTGDRVFHGDDGVDEAAARLAVG